MRTLGITGHQSIPDTAIEHIRRGIAQAIDEAGRPFRGVSCLAVGADQLFARAILDAGGELVAIVPSRGYENTFDADGLDAYRALLNAAKECVNLDYDTPTQAAFMAGGQEVLNRCDHLIAVWDGQPSRGLGGTADIVAEAHRRGLEATVVWPTGVSR